MTQNSEQVKAIAEKIKQAEDDCYDSGHMELDSTMFHEVVFNILTEALSTQPTATASAEELFDADSLIHNEIMEMNIEKLRYELWETTRKWYASQKMLFAEVELRRKESEATEQLRKELEQTKTASFASGELHMKTLQEMARLTAEVERLKLFRKNAVEFLLLSEKQGNIVSSNQCTDMETAFASADDRFFVVDNSADDVYQNLGFVYRKASRGKDEAGDQRNAG